MLEIWFWQTIVSPHMTGLAVALARQGHDVTYVAQQESTADRIQQGWQIPDIQGVKVRFAKDSVTMDALASEASAQSVHLCQGIHGNGKVSRGQRTLAQRGLRQWVVIETIDDAGVIGIFKRWAYGRLFRSRGSSIEGVLAIGHKTVDWITARGLSADRVYPFAYFLPGVNLPKYSLQRRPGPFRFLFVGQFINRKRFDLLVCSLQGLLKSDFELLVVGSGPSERNLRVLAERALPNRVLWLERLSHAELPQIMVQSDCLVLPSQHDGWGAVISEALMAGTPVICSDACGAAGVVQASGFGGVFPRNRVDVLQVELDEQIKSGPIDMPDRIRLASWSAALGAEAGARYLISILHYASNVGSRPMPPWHILEN